MRRILAKNGHREGPPNVGGFQSDIRTPQLRGVSNFHFRVLRDFENKFL